MMRVLETRHFAGAVLFLIASVGSAQQPSEVLWRWKSGDEISLHQREECITFAKLSFKSRSAVIGDRTLTGLCGAALDQLQVRYGVNVDMLNNITVSSMVVVLPLYAVDDGSSVQAPTGSVRLALLVTSGTEADCQLEVSRVERDDAADEQELSFSTPCEAE